MKRDTDLVRQILIDFERDLEWPAGGCFVPDDPLRSYHLHPLIQAGLIEGSEHQVLGGAPPRFLITGLTWQGHDFVAASADQGRWTRFKKSAETALSSIPFPVIIKMFTDGVEFSVRSALESHGFVN